MIYALTNFLHPDLPSAPCPVVVQRIMTRLAKDDDERFVAQFKAIEKIAAIKERCKAEIIAAKGEYAAHLRAAREESEWQDIEDDDLAAVEDSTPAAS